jgi:hypothetical protein
MKLNRDRLVKKEVSMVKKSARRICRPHPPMLKAQVACGRRA